MTKKLLIVLLTMCIPSICYAQTDKKISELTVLTTPASDDIVPVTDTSAGATKSLTLIRVLEGATGVTDDGVHVANGTTIQMKVLPSCSNATDSKLLYNSSTNTFSCGTDQNSGGGGGLGASLSSTGDNIFSTTGSVTFDGMTLYAESFVSTGGTISILDDLEVLNELIIPAYQDCSTLLQTGEVCIDGNISGSTDVMAFKGSDGNERVNINMLKSAIVSINDNDSLYFNAASSSWVTLPANLPFWTGIDGSQVYPLTYATTDLYIGGNTSGTADIWAKATGGVIFNQNNADTHFNVQGTTIEYLIYTDEDQLAVGTNTPAVGATLTVQGTLAVTGTLLGAITFDNLASADPCTSAGTDEILNNSIFMKTGGILCYCDNSGVDKKVVDDSACF